MASLVGTVVSIFKMLLPHVENYFGIDSVWGAPRNPSDKIQHWTNSDVGELVVSAQRCDYRLAELDAILDQNCEHSIWARQQFELLHHAIRKHLPALAADLVCAPSPPAPVRKHSVFKPATQKFAASAMTDADKPPAPPSMRAGHDIELLVAVPSHERGAGSAHHATRVSFAAPQGGRPDGRFDGDDGVGDDDQVDRDGDVGRYAYVAMRDDGGH
jgi:hypothetical protein